MKQSQNKWGEETERHASRRGRQKKRIDALPSLRTCTFSGVLRHFRDSADICNQNLFPLEALNVALTYEKGISKPFKMTNNSISSGYSAHSYSDRQFNVKREGMHIDDRERERESGIYV